MNELIFELKRNIPPHFKKGQKFLFDMDQGDVYAFLDGKFSEYPLRGGISGYFNFLLMYGEKYFKSVE